MITNLRPVQDTDRPLLYVHIDIEPYVETRICGSVIMQLNANEPGWVDLADDSGVALSHPTDMWEFMRELPEDPFAPSDYSFLMLEWTTLALLTPRRGLALDEFVKRSYPIQRPAADCPHLRVVR